MFTSAPLFLSQDLSEILIRLQREKNKNGGTRIQLKLQSMHLIEINAGLTIQLVRLGYRVQWFKDVVVTVLGKEEEIF